MTQTSIVSSNTSKKIFLVYQHPEYLAPMILVNPDVESLEALDDAGWIQVKREEIWIH